MTFSSSQVRLLVMILVAWCALSAAPVVATSPALPAAFFVIGLGLVGAVTLRFSTLAGFVVAGLGTVLFGVSMVSDQSLASPGTSQGLGALARPQLVLPLVMAGVSLLGTAVCGWLASWGIEGRAGVILPGVAEAGQVMESGRGGELRAAGERPPGEEPEGSRESIAMGKAPDVLATGVEQASRGEVAAPVEKPAPQEPEPLPTATDPTAPEEPVREAPVLVEESAARDSDQGERPVDRDALEAAGAAGRPRRRPDSVPRPPRRRKR